MSFSYNNCAGVNDRVDFIRALISDTQMLNHVFEDEEILAFYSIQTLQFQSSMRYSGAGGANLPASPVSVLRVAALALDALAANASKLSAVTDLLDAKMDLPKVADSLRAQAKQYRQVDDDSGAFVIIEQAPTYWSFRDRFWKQVQRESA